MVRVGGFLKTQNRIRRQRARGRFISPYQVGGDDFWQVDDGALSVDEYDASDQPRTLEGETGPASHERGHDFWQVHPQAEQSFQAVSYTHLTLPTSDLV